MLINDECLLPSVAVGFGGELLLQRGLAMVEQQVFVVPEIAVAAIFSDEGMGSGVQGQLRDEYHHLLAFGKGVLHKVKCSFQRGAGGFLCLIPGLGKGLELCAQEVKGGLCAHSIGTAQLRIPAAEGGIHLQAGIQRVMAQQTGGTLALGLGIIVRDHLTEQGKLPIRDVCRQGGEALFGLPQEGVAGIGDGIGLPGSSEPGVQTGQDQTDSESRSSNGALSRRA